LSKEFPLFFNPISVVVDVSKVNDVNFSLLPAIQERQNELITKLMILVINQRRIKLKKTPEFSKVDLLIDEDSDRKEANWVRLQEHVNLYFNHDVQVPVNVPLSHSTFSVAHLESKDSSGLQIADIIANLTYRYYNESHSSKTKKLFEKQGFQIDTDNFI
jgi:hypothetical protein